MVFLASFFPMGDIEQEETEHKFDLVQDFLRATVDLADLVGIYLVMQRVSGKGQVKVLVAGLGWAFAELVLTRLALHTESSGRQHLPAALRLTRLPRLGVDPKGLCQHRCCWRPCRGAGSGLLQAPASVRRHPLPRPGSLGRPAARRHCQPVSGTRGPTALHRGHCRLLQGRLLNVARVICLVMLFNDQNRSPMIEGHIVSSCPRLRQCGV